MYRQHPTHQLTTVHRRVRTVECTEMLDTLEGMKNGGRRKSCHAFFFHHAAFLLFCFFLFCFFVSTNQSSLRARILDTFQFSIFCFSITSVFHQYLPVLSQRQLLPSKTPIKSFCGNRQKSMFREHAIRYTWSPCRKGGTKGERGGAFVYPQAFFCFVLCRQNHLPSAGYVLKKMSPEG